MKIKIVGVLAIVMGLAAVTGTSSAQPGSQPNFFYGEEPWGGSYLGVDTRDISSDRLEPLHLKEERGVEVTMVDQDAPAGKAGLKEHDVILTVNDQQVESVEQLRRLIREIPAGRTITVGISRDGQAMSIKAQLAERKNMPDMEHAFHFNVPPMNIPAIHIPQMNMPEMDMPMTVVVIHSVARSGLMIENLTPQLGDYFGVKGGNGVMVRSVEKGSRAEQGGFRAGDVIVKVNGAPVNDSSDFTRLLRARKESKASITVIRERREQNLILPLPSPKQSGELNERDCDSKAPQACAEMLSEQAAQIPAITTADIQRIRPELAQAQKELQGEILNNGDELKKEMQQAQEDLREQQREIQRQMKEWGRDGQI